jgi:hypothetical protein
MVGSGCLNLKQWITIVFVISIPLVYQSCDGLQGFQAHEAADLSSVTSALEQGKILYQTNCQSCHQPLANSVKLSRTPDQIRWALTNVPQMGAIKLSDAQVRLISEALKTNLSICEVQEKPGHIPTSRLSHNEYNRAVNHLFAISGNWTASFTSENAAGLFENEAFAKQTNSLLTAAYFNVSKQIVDTVFANATAKSKLITCGTVTGEACANLVTSKIARLAFRRNLESTEASELLAPYRLAITNGRSFDESLKASLRAILINPNFLFKVHSATAQNIRELTNYELASRLAFFIWGSIPDDALLNAAARSDFKNTDILKAQLARMLADPRSDYLVEGFAHQWLGLDKIYDSSKQPDPTLFPQYTPELRDDMIAETKTFVRNLIRDEKSPLDIIRANYSYMNQRLATHYGLPTTGLTTNFSRVSLDANRTGLLTHASIMRMTSNPNDTSIVNRGIWIMERIICEQPPGDPPPEVDTIIPDDPNFSVRQRLEQHRSSPACMSCHAVMDPIGYGFEKYGPLGQFRTTWSDGFTVDASGSLPDGSKFVGAPELATKVESNRSFQTCFTKHMLSFATTRQMGLNDKCTINRIGTRDIALDSKFSDYLLKIILSDPFLRYQNQEVQ